jgi:KDO2-lipid IV(A) lauroyltransferase
MIRDGVKPRHAITFLPIIEVVRTGDREEAVRENTQRFTNAIEAIIRRYPDHWNWIHRRWKTRPPGETRFY